jgi:Xaa-Pro aminopeptidase
MTELLTIRDAAIADADALCQAERDVVSQHPGMLVSLPDELQVAAFRERIANAVRRDREVRDEETG